MYTLRRWWDRHALRVGLISLALSTAWLIRQTQGAAIFETYQVLTRPFQSGPTRAERLENAQLQELQQRLLELESQNQRLRELLGDVSNRSGQEVIAPVIGRSSDHWWQQIILGRGSQQGVTKDAIVTGTGGLVGRVIQVTSNTSRVLLISDPSSQIGVTISRSRSMGYLRGQAQNRAVMEFFDKVPDVRPGDVVSTSSFSQLFPAGLPVGRVESVDLRKSPAPEAVIELSAPISYLEWVIVAPNPRSADELSIPDAGAGDAE
jgi:rod shape-determining protein MreC